MLIVLCAAHIAKTGDLSLECVFHVRLSLMHSLETVRRQREGQIERITQQSVYAALGEKALSACVPTCFYMAAQNEGHLPHEISLTDFCRELNWAHAETASGWIRPDLSHQLRELYDLPVVSWRFGGNYYNSPEGIEKKCRAGYLQTQEEIDFFRQQIIGRDISEVVQQCCPVIAGVKAGFGANKTVHAVILQSWSEDGIVEVIDPDERNPTMFYPADYVRDYLNPNGGGFSVVLPRPESAEPTNSQVVDRFNTLTFPKGADLETRKHLMAQEIAHRIGAQEFDQLASLYWETLPATDDYAARLAALERLAATHWDFRRGRARQDAELTTVSPEDQLLVNLNDPYAIAIIETAAARFGMATSSQASRDTYDGLIVPGGASVSPLLRLTHALEQKGIDGRAPQYGWIALLGSDRKVGDAERAVVQFYAPDAETEFDLLAAAVERSLDITPLRDTVLQRVGYEYNPDTPPRVRYYKTPDDMAVFVLNAPIPDGEAKANTLRTYELLRAAAGERLSEGKHVLISSMALVRPVQHTDAEKFLGVPTGVNLETIGYGKDYSVGATGTSSGRPPKELLQEIKAYIDSLVRLNGDLV